MSNEEVKMTRQGVRDLSHLRAPKKGRILDMPPDLQSTSATCLHKETHTLASGFTVCDECGQSFRNDRS